MMTGHLSLKGVLAASLVALLVAALVLTMVALVPNPAGAAPKARTARGLQILTIPPGSFHADGDGSTYDNTGYWITTTGGPVNFTAPVYFPYPVVTIRKLVLYAYDNGGNAVCMQLHRVDPENGYGESVVSGNFCSTGASAVNPNEFTRTDLINRRFLMRHGAFINAYVPNGDYIFYGARIVYGH